MLALRFSLGLLCAGSVIAQVGVGTNCRHFPAPHDKTSFDQFLQFLEPAGASATFFALISEEKHLAVVGAAATAASAVYTYLRNQETVTVCDPPPTWRAPAGFGRLVVLGSGDVAKDLTSGVGTTFPVLTQDYHRLTVGQLQPWRPMSQPSMTDMLGARRAAASFLAAPPSEAQQLRGTVVNETGQRVPRAVVTIIPADNPALSNKLSTNWDGAFELLEPAGKYLIYVSVDGYEDFTTTYMKTALTDAPLQVHLVPTLGRTLR
jgi:hypothetical protein